MEIIRYSKIIHHVEWEMVFDLLDSPGSGYSFPCNEVGNINTSNMQGLGLENLRKCQEGVYPVGLGHIQKLAWNYSEPGIVKCDCGLRVYLDDSWANSCDCGREYSGNGQLLAPRSQWGEEFIVQPEEDYGLYPPYNPGE